MSKYLIIVVLFFSTTFILFPQIKATNHSSTYNAFNYFYNKNLHFNNILLNRFINKSLLKKIATNSPKMDSILTFEIDGGRAKILFEYSDSIKLPDFIILSLQDGQWVNNLKTSSLYIDDKIKQISYYYWNGENWDIAYLDEFEYDSLGNEIIFTSSVWNESVWQYFIKVNSFYKYNGYLSYDITERWVNGIWVPDSKSIYNYNQDGTKGYTRLEYYENNNWYNHSILEFFYNREGTLDSTVRKMWQNDSWINYLKSIWSYEKSSKVIVNNIDIYKWDSEKWDIDSRFKYLYNNLGYLKYGTFDFFNNGNWIPENNGISVINPDGFEFHYITNQLYVYYNNEITSVENNNNNIKHYALSQNYPNPFNPFTTISYSVKEEGLVKIKVYDILGNEVAELVNEHKQPGFHVVDYNASNLSSGVYLYTIQVNSFFTSKKMLLLK